MPDTHINAYYEDVEEAKQKVAVAQGELQAAKQRLAEKERQLGLGDDEPKVRTEADDANLEPSEEKKPGILKKK